MIFYRNGESPGLNFRWVLDSFKMAIIMLSQPVRTMWNKALALSSSVLFINCGFNNRLLDIVAGHISNWHETSIVGKRKLLYCMFPGLRLDLQACLNWSCDLSCFTILRFPVQNQPGSRFFDLFKNRCQCSVDERSLPWIWYFWFVNWGKGFVS